MPDPSALCTRPAMVKRMRAMAKSTVLFCSRLLKLTSLVVKNAPGFDAVIGNPPYDVMEKDRGAASWPHSALTEYVRVRPDYEQALGGKLNLFRFFVVRSLDLLDKDGRFGMILPLALLADKSTART